MDKKRKTNIKKNVGGGGWFFYMFETFLGKKVRPFACE